MISKPAALFLNLRGVELQRQWETVASSGKHQK